jgi:23S rRNA (pseudouridine1915-N3)-methyltransferase
LAGLEAEYSQRIQRFVPITVGSVPEARKVDPRKRASQLSLEARLLEKKIPLRCFLVTLDETGEEFTSDGFAGYLENLMNRGVAEIVFLGGGHSGMPKPLVDRSDLSLSLSKLTLPHELARVVLLEQIYRSFSIIRGLPYHR